ncbi:MAG: tRNA lysidine(34) synthetase TilS [Rhodobacter sp.]|nr:tRNA lysidine(34) synthetase TilS [Rhodobacter sp.]
MSAAVSALTAAFRAALGPADHPLGLAVSGGGDSVALLVLAADAGLKVQAVTVDHGLRPEAAAEAAWVGRLCAGLGVPHHTLHWQGWDGAGNLQDQARRARLSLIADWARAAGLGAVALGHTQDDQAETVLMRLARRAGVDGLSAMSGRRRAQGMIWLRPLLSVSRDELRACLRARGQDWIEDPSNDALRFDRVKARRALAHLAPLGITPAVLAGVADQMRLARTALEHQTAAAARQIARIEGGDVVMDRTAFLDLPAEIRRRLLVGALGWVGSAEYGPRAASVQALLAAVGAGRGGTLAGCRVSLRGPALRVTREWQAVRSTLAAPGQIWDRRWKVYGPDSKGLHVKALGGAGLSAAGDWRKAGLLRATLLASPSVWRDGVLIAAPLVRNAPGWTAELVGGADGFFLSLLSH